VKIVTAVYIDYYPKVVGVLDDSDNEVSFINTWLTEHKFPGSRVPMLFKVVEVDGISGEAVQSLNDMIYIVERNRIDDPGKVRK
jgi:hypothetical protein